MSSGDGFYEKNAAMFQGSHCSQLDLKKLKMCSSDDFEVWFRHYVHEKACGHKFTHTMTNPIERTIHQIIQFNFINSKDQNYINI